MATLNWSEELGVTQIIRPHARMETELDLALSPEAIRVLKGEIQELLDVPGSELRMRLSSGWTLFWKVREEGEGRVFLAHPEPDEWVANVSLEREMVSRLLTAITDLSSGVALELSNLGHLHRMSNLSVILRAAGAASRPA